MICSAFAFLQATRTEFANLKSKNGKKLANTWVQHHITKVQCYLSVTANIGTRQRPNCIRTHSRAGRCTEIGADFDIIITFDPCSWTIFLRRFALDCISRVCALLCLSLPFHGIVPEHLFACTGHSDNCPRWYHIRQKVKSSQCSVSQCRGYSRLIDFRPVDDDDDWQRSH